jgi:hypothetical protein
VVELEADYDSENQREDDQHRDVYPPEHSIDADLLIELLGAPRFHKVPHCLHFKDEKVK